MFFALHEEYLTKIILHFDNSHLVDILVVQQAHCIGVAKNEFV